MDTIFNTISSSVIAIGLFISSLFGTSEKPQELGASIPISVAVFQTSLATKISTSDTSMTLVLGTNKAGNALSGYSCFNIDEGTSVEEFVCGTASGTSVTSMRRGIDPVDGYTEVTSLKKAHGRGASVKITNFPQIAITSRLLNGQDSIPNAIFYGSSLTFSSSTQIVTKGYVDGVAIAGSPIMTTSVQGIAKVSTAPASSTNPIVVGDNDIRIPTQGENDALVGSTGTPSTSNPYITLQDVATTTRVNAIIRASSTGLIDSSFFVSSNVQIFTATGTQTWTKPSGAKWVEVTVIGAGGGGAAGHSPTSVNNSGGAGGGYGFKRFSASALSSTETVVVGAGGAGGTQAGTNTGTTGGYSSFGTTVLIKQSGGGGGTVNTGVNPAGGSGNGDVKYTGGTTSGSQSTGVDTATDPSPRAGGYGAYDTGTPASAKAGLAGGSFITNYVLTGGAGGASGVNDGIAGTTTSSGLIYGGVGGGGGGYNGNGTNTGGNGGAGGFPGGGGGGSTGTGKSGGAGADGMVVVVTYF